MDAWIAFLRAYKSVLARLDDELRAEHDLPLSWYEVLLFLDRAPERRLRMGELATSVVLTPSGVTRLVDRLESAGLVERRQCPTDRRGTEVVLTASGRGAFRRAAPTHVRGVKEHFTGRLSSAEQRVLAETLGRIAGP